MTPKYYDTCHRKSLYGFWNEYICSLKEGGFHGKGGAHVEVNRLKKKWQSFLVSMYNYVLKESINF